MTWQHKYVGKNEESKKRQLENLKIGRKRQIKQSKLTISSKSLQEANIIEFATSPQFLNLSFQERSAQEVLLRTLYGLALSVEQKPKFLEKISSYGESIGVATDFWCEAKILRNENIVLIKSAATAINI